MKKHLISSLLLTFALFLYIFISNLAKIANVNIFISDDGLIYFILILSVILSWLNYFTNNEKPIIMIPLYIIFLLVIIYFFIFLFNIQKNNEISNFVFFSTYLLIFPAIVSTAIGLFKER